MNQNEKKQPPVHREQMSGLQISLWENPGKEPNTTFLTATLQRSYKDKEGKWQTTNSLRINDLPSVESLCRKAYEWAKTNKKTQPENPQ